MAQIRSEEQQKKNKVKLTQSTLRQHQKKSKELKQTIQSAPDSISDYVYVDIHAEREYWIHE